MHHRRWSVIAALSVMLACAHAEPPIPRVVWIQPSADEVPANLLRISIRFASEVGTPALPQIALMHTDGRVIQQPFLGQELWSPDGRVLTLLLHPGRVKSDLQSRVEMGPILASGDEIVLTVGGHPVKRWQVGPVDHCGPVTSAWKISPAKANTRRPLVVTFDGPLDGRDVEYLAVADADGRRVVGQARFATGEGAWSFIPKTRWRAGAYELVVRGTLEDPAGNQPGSRFETSTPSLPGPPTDLVLPFAVSFPRAARP